MTVWETPMTNVILAFIFGGCSQSFDDKTPLVTPNDEEEQTLTPNVLGDGLDRDDDGYGETVDCDDNNPSINPDAVDYSGDNIDQNCDGVDEPGLCADECSFEQDGECDDGGNDSRNDVCALGTDCTDCGPRRDNDGDGFYDNNDCDDNDASISPNGIEIVNDGIDQDCDGLDLEGLCADTCEDFALDGECDDGGTNAAESLCSLGTDCTDCGPRIDEDLDGWDHLQDCDETDGKINPSASDITCDGIDQNCDGELDEGWNEDPYEDNNTNPVDFGKLTGTTQLDAYIFPIEDEDKFSFYAEDIWYLPDFGFEIRLENVPASLDLGFTVEFTDEEGVYQGVIAVVDNYSHGSQESLLYEGDSIPGGSEGTYTITVFGTGTPYCNAPYRLVMIDK